MQGADPNTDWLKDSVRCDDQGYLVTGALMETSLPRVFAAGDVRSGSTKRVAAAVGEGSAAVRSVHDYLAFDHQLDAGRPHP